MVGCQARAHDAVNERPALLASHAALVATIRQIEAMPMVAMPKDKIIYEVGRVLVELRAALAADRLHANMEG